MTNPGPEPADELEDQAPEPASDARASTGTTIPMRYGATSCPYHCYEAPDWQVCDGACLDR